MASDRDAFVKLGTDFLKLGNVGGENGSPLDRAYKEFGGELVEVGRTFDTLAADFLKLGDALHGGGGGAGDVANTIGNALSLIYQQFHLLDQKFEALGDGSVRLISELLPAVQHEGDGSVTVLTGAHGGGSGRG